MKVKLLKKIREIGLNQVTIYSYETTETISNTNIMTGISYSCNDHDYTGLFHYGDTLRDFQQKVLNLYLKKNIETIRQKYRKYSCKYKRSL